ncbi:hypothetical protein Dsin_017693 [Dipteronia sinensis]|uniref:Uncharacterized protein n=1 Tax=Dipteronia sinensis TaxID=43782 RepID=A0AAE0AGU0_9ROSI|nr:hypothetical protein Dsin_017693 [Dipteronia sinensis]
MSNLSNDELSLILNFMRDKNDRKSFALVCKQWLRVEGLARRSILVHEPDSLHHFLPRFPNLVEFTSPKFLTNDHLEFVSKTCPRLENLHLNLRQSNEIFDELELYDVDDDGACAIAENCPNLSKVSLRMRKNIGNSGVISIIGKLAQNLTYLDMGMCILITDRALEWVWMLSSITVLKLDGCSLITDLSLAFLANGYCSKTLKKLFVSECDRVTDVGVSLLRHMSCLEELSLADCGPLVTDISGVAITFIKTLKRLDFSWLINLSDITIIAINQNCKDLVELNLTGCTSITGFDLHVFANHEHLESIILVSCYYITSFSLDMMLQCKSLNYIVVDKRVRLQMSEAAKDRIDALGRVHWR